MKLECRNCWEKKGKGFDVITEHSINTKEKTAKCNKCGCIQEIELLSKETKEK